MSKKVKILLAVAIAAVVLVAGLIVVPVLAADTPVPTPPPALAQNNGVLERTAKILNISPEALLSAVKQTRSEFWAKPDGSTPSAPSIPGNFYDRVAAILGNGMTGNSLATAMQQAVREMGDERITTELGRAFQSGKITQEEQTQIKDWLDKRPAALDKLAGFFRGFGPMMGRGGGGFGGRCFGFGRR
jgi:hypothetical protein